MARYVETAARQWWLWLVALLLPGVVVAALWLLRAPQYDVQTTIWAERATYLNVPGDSPWITPAQAQAGLLSELLRTRAFINGVAADTELRAYTTTEEGQVFLEEYLRRRLWVFPTGAQLIEITFRTGDPAQGVVVLNGVVRAYTEHVTQSSREQARLASEFYGRQLPDREREMAAAAQALRGYLAAMGSAPALDQLPANERLLQSAQYAELQRREDLARKRYDDTIANLERVQMLAGARETAQERGFRVLDPPTVPSRPSNARREMLLLAGGAVGAGLVVGLGGTLLLTWLDPTLRSGGDVRRRLQMPVIGSLPRYRRSARGRRRASPPGRVVGVGQPGAAATGGRLAGAAADD